MNASQVGSFNQTIISIRKCSFTPVFYFNVLTRLRAVDIYTRLYTLQSSFSIWWCTKTALRQSLVTVLRVMFEIIQTFKGTPRWSVSCLKRITVIHAQKMRGVPLCRRAPSCLLHFKSHFNQLQTMIKSLSLVPLMLKESESTAFNDFFYIYSFFQISFTRPDFSWENKDETNTTRKRAA